MTENDEKWGRFMVAFTFWVIIAACIALALWGAFVR